MLITLNQKDICKIIAQAMTGNPSITEATFTVEVGVQDNSIVAVVAAGEPLPHNLVQLSSLAEPKTSGAAIASPTETTPLVDSDAVNPDDDLEDDPDSPPQENGQPKKRKRRTKAQIEEDRLKEAQAQAETPVEATEAVATEQATTETQPDPEPAKDDPFAAMSEPATDHATAHQETAAEVALDESTPPFDIDEGAVVRAQADDAPLTDPNDPFAEMSEVSSNADELFAQPADAKVTSVTKEEDGFVKPVEEETDDPFASFN